MSSRGGAAEPGISRNQSWRQIPGSSLRSAPERLAKNAPNKRRAPEKPPARALSLIELLFLLEQRQDRLRLGVGDGERLNAQLLFDLQGL